MQDGADLSNGEDVYRLDHQESSINSQHLCCRVAASLTHVEVAWNLVYQCYLKAGLIETNPFRLHTTTPAVQRGTCVVLRERGECIESTLSLISDGAHGVPLDSVYADELKALRSAGRTLLEVGLLADRCPERHRGMDALFEMMNWAIYYAHHRGLSDLVIGVHPRHAKFYSYTCGFEQFGPQAVYPTVKNNPVVPLRLRLNEQFARPRLRRGLRYSRNNPLDSAAFAARCDFSEQTLEDSAIERFMMSRRRQKSKSGKRRTYSLTKTLRAALLRPMMSPAEPANL